MKRRTRALQYADIADAVKCINEDKKVKRSTYKDGSIPTQPVMPVADLPEKQVVKDCIEWLHEHRIMCNRHDAGSFQNDHGQWGVYGIKSAGDIIGMVGDYGTHFEIECKRGSGGKLSPGQQTRMKDVEDNSGLYFVCHGVQELAYYMREWS